MNTKLETKPVIDSSNNSETVAGNTFRTSAKASTTEAADKFRRTLQQMDIERSALAKNAIEQLKPGRPFDPVVVRQINKIETEKNRLIVSRFAALLRKSSADVQAIVHQIIEL